MAVGHAVNRLYKNGPAIFIQTAMAVGHAVNRLYKNDLAIFIQNHWRCIHVAFL